MVHIIRHIVKAMDVAIIRSVKLFLHWVLVLFFPTFQHRDRFQNSKAKKLWFAWILAALTSQTNFEVFCSFCFSFSIIYWNTLQNIANTVTQMSRSNTESQNNVIQVSMNMSGISYTELGFCQLFSWTLFRLKHQQHNAAVKAISPALM